MKRDGSLVAAGLVVLTALGVSNLPKSSTGADTAAAGMPQPSGYAGSGRGAAAAVSGGPHAPCMEIQNRLQRFVAETNATPLEMKLPDSCYEQGHAPKMPPKNPSLPGVRFVIATVPNPLSTHLPLFFDRIVEAIQQAAQDELYSYDDSWFPWDASKKDYSNLADQLKAEDLQEEQRSQPGIIVFRRGLAAQAGGSPYAGGLIVFLVGEKPTGGIDDTQFDNALSWIAGFDGLSGSQPLRVLGPTFSGSLPSLRSALERQAFHGQIQVWSGTVSSGLAWRWFSSWIEKRKPGSFFHAAMENDALMTDRLCQYLTDQGYSPEDMAFLSEDETAFGRTDHAPASPCGRAVRLYYPRDIATLRSAYERQSILGSAGPQPSTNAPSTTLRGDLSEPSGNEHDTVRSYGGQLTPLAQESVLLDIVNRLSEHKIEFVILRSTSSLDQIFLSEFLRRSYPQGRLVIDGADLLFTRGAEGRSLRGVMLLSTYPLLTQEQDWTRTGSARTYRTFGEDTDEGEYIAARNLFGSPDGRRTLPLLDYAAPAWAARPAHNLAEESEDNRPATWLTVIGRRQFWPVAVLNTYTQAALKSDAEPMVEPFAEPPAGKLDSEALTLPTIMWMFLIACFFWSAAHLYFCWNGSFFGLPRARAYFAPIPRWQHPALIALGSLLPAMLAVVVASASGLWSSLADARLYPGNTELPLAISVSSILVLAVAACAKNYTLTPSYAHNTGVASAGISRFLVALAAILFFVLYAAGHRALISLLKPSNAVPAYWRAVNLQSGVSPMLPQLLLIAGVYVWFWCGLRGLAHFGDDRPVLPAVDDLPSQMPMFSREKAGDRVEDAARPLNPYYLCLFLGALLVIAGVCWVELQGFSVRTLGERAFGCLIFASVTLCIAAIVTDGIEMWWAWNELRQLLIFLDRLPLRRTLRALKGLEWGSIWKLSGNVLGERYRVLSLQIESLRHLTNSTAEWVPDWGPVDAQDCKIKIMRQLNECKAKMGAFAAWYVGLPENIDDLSAIRDFQIELASTAGLLVKHVLLPAWQMESDSLIFERSKPAGKAGEDAAVDELAISTAKLAPHVVAAEEFFVLPYLAFIQNTLGRLRTIALGMLWLFVAAALAVSSYPFDPLNVLGGIFLTVFAIVAGLSTIVYSQMSRDATLSHITNTIPGELGADFWIRMATFGIGPLAALLTTLFPSITDFVFSWLQPSVQSLK